MPSEERIQTIRAALDPAGQPFREAVSNTVRAVKTLIEKSESSIEGLAEFSRAELGIFAAGRIDPDRFSAVVQTPGAVAPGMLAVIERCLTTLEVFEQMMDNVIMVTADPGQSASAALDGALRQVGLAFGAARAVDLARNGEHVESKHRSLLDGLPFHMWTKAERLIAPPLVLAVDGDRLGSGLAEYMDGSLKIVLLSRGGCGPAPLVRLITPRTFVMQTRDPAAASAITKWSGPGALLIAEDIARFTHNPDGGRHIGNRLSVDGYPANPRSAIGGLSVRQQLEELEQLRALAGIVTADAPEATKEAEKDELPPDPADKLAAWLLNQAHGVEA